MTVSARSQPMPAPQRARHDDGWWRTAVIYQVYPRSFADGNGDGVGDLAGVRSRLPYLADLGVDAIWFAPWYLSPLADGGYDVADYRTIDPAFGTLAEAESLIGEARGLGIRTVVDVVPNHVSDQHPWFLAALAGESGGPERERFWFRAGRGQDGNEPPNGWSSIFGGSAWTRTVDPDGQPGDWYLHLFTPQQPDLNWGHPDVMREHEDVLRFWFDRGAAGVRIDSAALLAKDPLLPELASASGDGQHPTTDRDEVHAIYRAWRAVADEYPDARALVGEVWLEDVGRLARYLRPDELHTAFNFDFLARPWDAASLRASINGTLAAHAPVGAPATWVLSNHDVTRPATRLGRADSSFSFAAKQRGTPTDVALGTRRARAAALLTAALPGSLYVYQGDELGLDEVEDLPADRLQDPMVARSGGVDPGRDGCRVPLPWSGDRSPFGFSPVGSTSEPWLPQPPRWAGLTVEAQAVDPDSTLNLYRGALRLRRTEPDLTSELMQWIEAPEEVLAFRRGSSVACFVNFGTDAFELPAGAEVMIASQPTRTSLVPDAAVWVRLPPSAHPTTSSGASE